MDTPIQSMLSACDVFLRYVMQYPVVAETVLQKVTILQHAIFSSMPGDLVAGRDAASSLSMIAREEGYHDIADFFYHVYEDFCFRLLSATQGGLF